MRNCNFSFVVLLLCVCYSYSALFSPLDSQPTLRSTEKRQVFGGCDEVLVGAGQPCNASANIFCDLGFVCWADMLLEELPAEVGECIRYNLFERCAIDEDCGPLPLQCRSEICLPAELADLKFPGGYPCSGDSQCQSMSCVNEICATEALSSCAVESCSVSQYCSNASVCLPRIPLGGGCSQNEDNWVFYTEECELGSQCDIIGSKTCIPFFSKADGEPCFEDVMCASGFCDCQTMTCKTLSQLNSTVGNICSDDSDCGNGFKCSACSKQCFFAAAPAVTSCQTEYQASTACALQDSNSFLSFALLGGTSCPYCDGDGSCSQSSSAIGFGLISSCLLSYAPCSTEFFELFICSLGDGPTLSIPPSCAGAPMPSTNTNTTPSGTNTTPTGTNTSASNTANAEDSGVNPLAAPMIWLASILVIALTV